MRRRGRREEEVQGEWEHDPRNLHARHLTREESGERRRRESGGSRKEVEGGGGVQVMRRRVLFH